MSLFSGPWLTKNIELGAPLAISRWRKISMASWGVTRDSSVVTILELDADPALAYIASLQSQTKTKLTITHFAGYCLAKTFRKYPEANCIFRRGRLYPRKNVDACFLVASGRGGVKGSEDLSVSLVRNADHAGVVKIAEALMPEARTIKSGQDTSFRGIKYYIGAFPSPIRRVLVGLTDLIMNGMNLWSPVFGMKRDAFGSFALTSVGSLDIEFAIPRIYPQSRNVMIMAVCAVREKPVVKDGKVVVGRQLKIVFTADHRILDGLHASYLLKEFQSCFEHPEKIPVSSPQV